MPSNYIEEAIAKKITELQRPSTASRNIDPEYSLGLRLAQQLPSNITVEDVASYIMNSTQYDEKTQKNIVRGIDAYVNNFHRQNLNKIVSICENISNTENDDEWVFGSKISNAIKNAGINYIPRDMFAEFISNRYPKYLKNSETRKNFLSGILSKGINQEKNDLIPCGTKEQSIEMMQTAKNGPSTTSWTNYEGRTATLENLEQKGPNAQKAAERLKKSPLGSVGTFSGSGRPMTSGAGNRTVNSSGKSTLSSMPGYNPDEDNKENQRSGPIAIPLTAEHEKLIQSHKDKLKQLKKSLSELKQQKDTLYKEQKDTKQIDVQIQNLYKKIDITKRLIESLIARGPSNRVLFADVQRPLTAHPGMANHNSDQFKKVFSTPSGRSDLKNQLSNVKKEIDQISSQLAKVRDRGSEKYPKLSNDLQAKIEQQQTIERKLQNLQQNSQLKKGFDRLQYGTSKESQKKIEKVDIISDISSILGSEYFQKQTGTEKINIRNTKTRALIRVEERPVYIDDIEKREAIRSLVNDGTFNQQNAKRDNQKWIASSINGRMQEIARQKELTERLKQDAQNQRDHHRQLTQHAKTSVHARNGTGPGTFGASQVERFGRNNGIGQNNDPRTV